MLLISYHTKKSGLLLDDNRDVSEACVTRPLVRDWGVISVVRMQKFTLDVCVYVTIYHDFFLLIVEFEENNYHSARHIFQVRKNALEMSSIFNDFFVLFFENSINNDFSLLIFFCWRISLIKISLFHFLMSLRTEHAVCFKNSKDSGVCGTWIPLLRNPRS